MGTCGLNHGYRERLAGHPIGETDLGRHSLRLRAGDSDRQNHRRRLPSGRWGAGLALATVWPEEEAGRFDATHVFLACVGQRFEEEEWRPCGNGPGVLLLEYEGHLV